MTDSLIIEYWGAGGYPQSTRLRPVTYDDLPNSLQIDWGQGNFYQAANFREGDTWATVMGDYGVNAEDALLAAIPWHVLEMWQGEGLVVHHPIYYIVKTKRSEKLIAQAAEREAIQQARRAVIEAELAAQLAFETRLNTAKATVTWRKSTLVVTLTDNTTGESRQETLTGYNIVTVPDHLPTGFFINKERQYWNISHCNTACTMGISNIKTQNDAAALVALLHELWAGWPTMQEAAEMPVDLVREVRTLNEQWLAYVKGIQW